MLLNVGSGGGAAAAPAAGGAAGGAAAAAEEAPKEEEKKEEGTFGHQSTDFGPRKDKGLLTYPATPQRRKSPTRTWASVCSTKRPELSSAYSPAISSSFTTSTPRKPNVPFAEIRIQKLFTYYDYNAVPSLARVLERYRGMREHDTLQGKMDKASRDISGISKRSSEKTSVRDELWPAKTHADLSEPQTSDSEFLRTLICPKMSIASLERR